MCRGLPARVIRVDGESGWIEQAASPGEPARTLRISLLGVDDVKPGDYVFHHAGLALARIEPEEAALILAAWEELDALVEAESTPLRT